MFNILIFLLVAVFTFLATFVVRNLALIFGIVDKPGRRKVHKESIPLLGGLAIYLGLVLGLLLSGELFNGGVAIFLGASLIFALGLLDDIRGLPAKIRFIVQCLAAFLLISKGIKISFLPPGALGDLGEIVLTLVWIVGLTNAFNYLDGLNGLACGSAIVNAFYLYLVFFITSQSNLALICLILMASCLGFLPHNFKKARIFLGDAGSMLLGFLLAAISLSGQWAQDDFTKIAVPILIMGVPIFDMTFTTVMRIRDGKVKTVIDWLKYSGKDHFHHYLVHLGFKPVSAVIFIWVITFSLGINAILFLRSGPLKALLALFQASIIFAIIAWLIVTGRRHRSGWRIGE